MITVADVVLPGVPESVRAARALVRHELGEGHPAAETAALLVSELVTNAIAYTRSGRPGGTVTVSVETWTSPGAVCLRVRDSGGRGAPALAPLAPGAEHGYGLRIVAALCAEWGTDPGPDGTCTWCRVTWEEVAGC